MAYFFFYHQLYPQINQGSKACIVRWVSLKIIIQNKVLTFEHESVCWIFTQI